jgi:hypothetical protein
MFFATLGLRPVTPFDSGASGRTIGLPVVARSLAAVTEASGPMP